MNLNTLSGEYAATTGGKIVGFVVRSVRHSDRTYKVEAKLGNGKFAITRVETGESYFVDGTEDRYTFAISLARVRELKGEIVELEEQAATIAARLSTLTTELGDIGIAG